MWRLACPSVALNPPATRLFPIGQIATPFTAWNKIDNAIKRAF
jgi:hypothetical protein